MLGEGFWEEFVEKRGEFSNFWQFSIELGDSGRVLKAESMEGRSGDSAGGCDSKTAPNISLFCCLVTGGCDELAVSVNVGGRKRTFLVVSGLA